MLPKHNKQNSEMSFQSKSQLRLMKAQVGHVTSPCFTQCLNMDRAHPSSASVKEQVKCQFFTQLCQALVP